MRIFNIIPNYVKENNTNVKKGLLTQHRNAIRVLITKQ